MIDLLIKNIVPAGKAGKGNSVIPLFYSIFDRFINTICSQSTNLIKFIFQKHDKKVGLLADNGTPSNKIKKEEWAPQLLMFSRL